MLLSAFIMGLVGSLHCAAMCGPLVLAIPVVGRTRPAYLGSRLVYNFGRITVYAALGLIFGAIGKSLLLAGFQRWISIGTGAAMLIFLILGRKGINHPFWKGPVWIQSIFREFIQRRTFLALFILGAANGLLPCGLVYMAGTASLAAGGLGQSALFMMVFGAGTLPVMLGLTLSGGAFPLLLRQVRFKSLAPLTITLVALSLILRGMSLGIPYLSPELTTEGLACPACAP